SAQAPVQDEFNVSGEFVPNPNLAALSPQQKEAPAVHPSATEPDEGNVVVLANGGFHSDVRTTTEYLTGAPAPPNAEELQALGEQILTALDTGDNQFIAQLAQANANQNQNLPIPQSEVPSVVETSSDLPPEGTYTFGAGDSFDVTVFDMPELGRALTIRPDGYVSFPLIREIKAAGKTPSELEEVFKERLSEHIFSPEVSIVVTSVASKSYFIFGAVNRVGPSPLFRDTTLLQAILSNGGPISRPEGNGGPVPIADMSRIRVIRNHGNTREVITKNLSGMSAQEMMLYEDIPIQAGDIIYVPSKDERLVYVFGEVRPAILPIRENARLLDALLSVGGIPPSGQDDQILVIRPQGNGARYWCVSMKAIERGQLSQNIMLEGGDIIYVPQKFISKVAEFVQLFAGAAGPFMSTYLTAWDAWWVHERFSALRARNFGNNDSVINQINVNPDL
ncbi:MAG: polysaccharide biosynthesis/export family protein, partial [Candidatus Omnitrophica bacterium]|nr:polysaccharide biosynthesis/export family protein [Candidatus Omnitrophota bacterium]